jgi:3-isopropylmalate/(R)-2-methylmalate dehydratase large subunit
MTIAEKILARAAGLDRVSAGDFVVVDVDVTMLLDTAFHPSVRQQVLCVHDPEKVVVVYDHYVPASDQQHAEGQAYGRKFVEKFGIERFHDVGENQGIGHAVLAEYGYALPGQVVISSDSHTCASGAFNCAARGVGHPDLIGTLTTGQTWFQVAETVRYDFVGRLRPGVSAKDVFLYLAGEYGDHFNRNVEFGGAGLGSLSVNARRTLAAMSAELSAEFAIFEYDDVLDRFIRSRSTRSFTPTFADDHAAYAERRTVDLSLIGSLVARPDRVINNSAPVEAIAGERINQAFIGSCANGTLDDLAEAARIVKGKKVAPGVRFLVTPGTQRVYREALEAGIIQTLMEAGAVVTPATCGACFGGHMGVLGAGETCITASTRNFKGRMGHPSARIFVASPATVAASAVAGVITAEGVA